MNEHYCPQLNEVEEKLEAVGQDVIIRPLFYLRPQDGFALSILEFDKHGNRHIHNAYNLMYCPYCGVSIFDITKESLGKPCL